jgi:hypothetical protein
MGTNEPSFSNKSGSILGIIAFLLAVVTAASVVMIGFTSFTPFNPPDWLRILSMAPLPFAIILSIGFGVAGLKKGSGRVWAIAGFILAGLSIAAFFVMIAVGG